MIVYLPRLLDAKGRCCGRKPIFYKTKLGMRLGQVSKDPHHFCATCDAEFTPEGKQRANWAWEAMGAGFIRRGFPPIDPNWESKMAAFDLAEFRLLQQHRKAGK